MRTTLMTLASLALASGPAAALPDLDAVVSYETQQRLASGITRTERWQERLSRQGEKVWTERLLAGPASHAHEGPEHKHFDFDTAARLVERGGAGDLQLRFVDRTHRRVVSVPKAEYGAVNFDGRWDAAAYLVPPGLIAQMKPLDRSAAEGVWREQRAEGWTHRVLWSESRQVALRIESSRDDGSSRRVVVLTPSSPAGRKPWAGIGQYEQKTYDDFLD
jgi:hypothetical protein